MRHIRTSVALLSFSAAVLLAPVALAGGCPTCDSAADCKSITADAVCVEWNEDPGCGGKLKICCPGQGCAVDSNGAPSCVATGKCKLVGAGGAGGGAGTAGSAGAAGQASGGSAGSAGTASGGTTSGTGGSVSTGGAANTPGGSSGDDGGCGCRTGTSRAPGGASLLLAGLAAALLRRRRRG